MHQCIFKTRVQEKFQFICKLSRPFGNFPVCLETFQFVLELSIKCIWKLSYFPGNFFQFVWKTLFSFPKTFFSLSRNFFSLSRNFFSLSGNFPGYLKTLEVICDLSSNLVSFQVVWKVSGLSGQ